MRILNKTGQLSYDDIQIESSVQKIGFKITCASLDDLQDVSVDVKLNDKSTGTKTIIPSIPLIDLLEIAAANEGFIYITSAGTDTIDVRGTVELSNDGALDVSKGYLSLSLKGCKAAQNWQIFAMDNASLTRSFIDYEPVYVNANAQKEIDVQKYYQLAVNKNITELQIQYMNGRTVTYSPEELEILTNEINELCIVDETGTQTADIANGALKTGSYNYYCLGLISAKSVKIIQSVSGNVYLVKNNDLGLLV